MKKFIIFTLVLIAGLATIALLRANYVYNNQQLPSISNQNPVKIDEAQATQRLSSAIQIPTISYDDSALVDTQMFARFHQFLQQAYPLVHQNAEKTVINQHSLVFHLPGKDTSLKPVLFLAHMDVVPVDDNTLSKWTHAPFGGDIIDSVIWGRGTMDDKGGLIALMEAVELMLKNNTRPNRSLYLAFGHDEEVGGSQGAAKIAQYFAEKSLEFEFVLDEGGAKTQGLMQGINQPVALIGIAEKGFVNINLSVNDIGGHASQPPAHTAVGILSQAIVNLEQNPYPADLKFTEMTFDAIGSEASFGSRLAMANLWLTSALVKKTLMAKPKLAASLHTTIAATMVQGSAKSNVLPTQATAVVNVRIFPGETYDTVKAYFETIIDDPRVKVTTSMKSNPSPVSAIDSYGFQLIAQSIRNLDSNALVAPYLVQGGTDSKYFYGVSNNIYRFLMIRATPETLKRLHGIDEQISVAEYLGTIRFYYQILSKV
jgi:carboxypeptidase PM20D1